MSTRHCKCVVVYSGFYTILSLKVTHESSLCLACFVMLNLHASNSLLSSCQATGPISYATYMQMCLSHPKAGYYMNPSNNVIGSKGDFITSPEISQVFGEVSPPCCFPLFRTPVITNFQRRT